MNISNRNQDELRAALKVSRNSFVFAGFSAGRLVDQATQMPYCLACIEVTEGCMAKLKGRTLQAGMPVETMIKTGERICFDYLIRPFRDRVARAFRKE